MLHTHNKQAVHIKSCGHEIAQRVTCHTVLRWHIEDQVSVPTPLFIFHSQPLPQTAAAGSLLLQPHSTQRKPWFRNRTDYRFTSSYVPPPP